MLCSSGLAAAPFELLAGAARTRIVAADFGHGAIQFGARPSLGRHRDLPRSPVAPVGGDPDDATREQLRRLRHDAILNLRRQAKQRVAVIVAAERQDGE
jgi:hypothetical protein